MKRQTGRVEVEGLRLRLALQIWGGTTLPVQPNTSEFSWLWESWTWRTEPAVVTFRFFGFAWPSNVWAGRVDVVGMEGAISPATACP